MKKLLNQFPFIRNLLLGIRHWLWAGKTKKALSVYLAANSSAKLQLGAGQNILTGWFNTDYFPRKNIFFIDVTQPFYVPSNSFDFIFTEHHIEHISYRDAVFMLTEAFRILKPGGVIKVITPDLESGIGAYFTDEINGGEFINHAKQFIYSGFHSAKNYIPVDDYFKAHEINDMFFNYEHKFIYDFESLKRILFNAGFTNIIDSRQKSVHPEFLDIESHTSNFDKKYALSVEAQKV